MKSKDMVEAMATTLHAAWAAITEAELRKAHPELFDGSQAFYPTQSIKQLLVLCTTPFEHLPEEHKALARLHAAQWLATSR